MIFPRTEVRLTIIDFKNINHGQMLYEPNVKILADQLKKSIQEHFNQPET